LSFRVRAPILEAGTPRARRTRACMIGRPLLAALFIVVALAIAVIATGRDRRIDCTTPMLDEHGYLIPAAGCTERRGSLVVHRQLAGA
jgi:hypothetical protein